MREGEGGARISGPRRARRAAGTRTARVPDEEPKQHDPDELVDERHGLQHRGPRARVRVRGARVSPIIFFWGGSARKRPHAPACAHSQRARARPGPPSPRVPLPFSLLYRDGWTEKRSEKKKTGDLEKNGPEPHVRALAPKRIVTVNMGVPPCVCSGARIIKRRNAAPSRTRIRRLTVFPLVYWDEHSRTFDVEHSRRQRDELTKRRRSARDSADSARHTQREREREKEAQGLSALCSLLTR